MKIILFLSAFPLLFAGMTLFDRVIRIEYERHKTIWIATGRPHGYFWIPAEVKRFSGLLTSPSSGFARDRLALKLLVSTPKWMHHDGHANRLLIWYRVVFALVNFCLLGYGYLLFRGG